MIRKSEIKQQALEWLAELLGSAKVTKQTIETVQSSLGCSCNNLRLSFLSGLMSNANNGRFRLRKAEAKEEEVKKLNRDISEISRICIIACDPCNYSESKLLELQDALHLVIGKSKDYTKKIASKAIGQLMSN